MATATSSLPVQDWIQGVSSVVTKDHLIRVATASVILLVGMFFARRAQAAVLKIRTLDVPQKMLFQKVAYYGLFLLSVAAALDTLGFDLRVLLGAAGVLTVAIGFAAQTSASNLISGLFLMFERPFVVGDTIAVGDTKGDVISIDLLSTKIRTFPNLMIRIPNETLVKSNIVNLSYFPIRRLELSVGVAYGSNLKGVEELLKQIIFGHPLVLREPAPLVQVKGFGESSIDFKMQVWSQTSHDLGSIESELYQAIDRGFRASGVDIPFPTRTLLQPVP